MIVVRAVARRRLADAHHRCGPRDRRIALETPGIVRVAAVAGLSGATRTQAVQRRRRCSCGVRRAEVRLKKGLTAAAITDDLRKRLFAIEGAFIIVFPPPSVPGIGTGGGFTMRIEDRQGRGPQHCRRAPPMNSSTRAQGAGADLGGFRFAANTPQVYRRHRPRSRRRSSACRCRTSSRRSRPISARPTSTISIISAAPSTSPRRPTRRSAPRPPIWRACRPATPPATWCRSTR